MRQTNTVEKHANFFALNNEFFMTFILFFFASRECFKFYAVCGKALAFRNHWDATDGFTHIHSKLNIRRWPWFCILIVLNLIKRIKSSLKDLVTFIVYPVVPENSEWIFSGGWGFSLLFIESHYFFLLHLYLIYEIVKNTIPAYTDIKLPLSFQIVFLLISKLPHRYSVV